MTRRTIHFQPPEIQRNESAESKGSVALPNPLDRVTEIMRDIELLTEKCSRMFSTTNRHGDLLVMRSAQQRLGENLSILIDNEERG